MKKGALALVALLFTTGFVACGSDGPTPPGGGGGGPTLTGSYTATQWVTTGGSGSANQLLAGSTLAITLNSNGTTSGHLHLVASGGNPPLDADMAGTWMVTGADLTFSQNADTFVRNMTFVVVANGNKWALEGDQVLSQTRIQLTLTQS